MCTFCLSSFAALSILVFNSLGNPAVTVARTPQHGIQPQAAIDTNGAVHLIYLKDDPGAANIFYARRGPGAEAFSAPVRVNSKPGTAIAVGTIRGPQLAVARGQVHVAWNGRAPKDGTWVDAPMLYTRLDESGTAFEPERNLITFARGLDGGGSITADEAGNVFVFWHVPKPGNTNGEAGRAVYVARSRDQGKTFSPETLVTTNPTGACGCCGMKAFSDGHGNIFALFRSASEMVNRDEILLAGRTGEELKPILKHPWKTPACPMSSASFTRSGSETIAAWESSDNVFFSRITDLQATKPMAPAGNTKRKHPTVAANAEGEILLVWTEGTAWGKGGSVAWQLFNPDGLPIGPEARAEGLPAWSLAAAVAKVDGSFEIIY